MSFDNFLKDTIKKDNLKASPDRKIKDRLLQALISRSASGAIHRNSIFSNTLLLKAASIALILYLGLNLNKLPGKLDSVSHGDSTIVKPHLVDSVNRFQIIDSLVQ